MRRALSLVALASCGRMGFAPTTGDAASGDGSSDDASIAGDASDTCPPAVWPADAFDGGLDNYFVFQGASTTVASSGGELSISLGGVASDYAGIVSAVPASFLGAAVTIEVVELPSAIVGPQGTFSVSQSEGNGEVGFLVEAGGLIGTAGVPFDFSRHQWLRIREAGGTIFRETRGASGGWTLFDSVPTPAWMQTDGALLKVSGGQWMDVTSAGTVRFDNVNLAPCP